MTGCKRGNWSAQELDRLKVLYPRCAEERVAELLGRSVHSVRRRGAALFKSPTRRSPWTGDEDHQLRVSWGVLDLHAIALVLARTERDVSARVEYLRRNKRRGEWTRSENNLLNVAFMLSCC